MRTLVGVVEKGTRRGNALGYPTINIPLTDDSVSGVYAARVYVTDGSSYAAAAFADQKRGILEAHLLDCADDLYGKKIRVELHEKIRDRMSFKNDTEARRRIERDVAAAREYFNRA